MFLSSTHAYGVRVYGTQFCGAMSALLMLAGLCSAQQRTTAYDLLPANAQAVVWVPDSDKLNEQWERTRLYDLANDPSIAPFFEEQRKELESKLVDAGWRLNIKPEDLGAYSVGQIALAWMEVPSSPRKPFAMALIADVDDDQVTNDKLLEKIDAELVSRQAQKASSSHLNVDISKYTLPRRADALLAEESYFAITGGQLFATDDETLIKELISRAADEEVAGDTISADPVFIKGRELLASQGEANVEYFIRPLGFARVICAIGGKRSKSSADMLAVLQNQGFDAIQCVCGELSFGLDSLDIAHRGYVLAEFPLPKSAGVLDFPNRASHEIPSFVTENVSSLLATHWNASEAFWRAEGLVDEIAGTEGVFDEVIQGIKLDTNGPRIDIEKDVLPHFTNDIYSMSDNKEGTAEVDSRRNLIALRLNNSAAMAKVLDRAMKNEPDAELVEFEGHQIWQVVRREDEEVVDLTNDFGSDFGAPAAQGGDIGEPEPWLSNWAITVFDDYLMFASHVEMIRDAVAQAKTGMESPILTESDYQRIVEAIGENFGTQDGSAWRIVRTSLAYRVQYELFREGKLGQSQSMLASILDRLLQNETEMRTKEQKISGNKLPPFEQISHFLQPSGMMVRTTDSGWEFGSLLLAGEDAKPQVPTELSSKAKQGTARVSNSKTESNR